MSFDHNLWGKVVPDGSRFCHWGGSKQSKKIIRNLEISDEDRVPELCCGQGGALDFVPQVKSLVGIDISKNAVFRGQKNTRNPQAVFVEGDVANMPFVNKSFNKVFAQDADVLMLENKLDVLHEVNRVMDIGGKIIWQNYISNEDAKSYAVTSKILESVGYVNPHMPKYNDLKDVFEKSGFSIDKYESLHEIYQKDNLKMLEESKKLYKKTEDKNLEALISLFEREKLMFKTKQWSGVMISATKKTDVMRS